MESKAIRERLTKALLDFSSQLASLESGALVQVGVVCGALHARVLSGARGFLSTEPRPARAPAGQHPECSVQGRLPTSQARGGSDEGCGGE